MCCTRTATFIEQALGFARGHHHQQRDEPVVPGIPLARIALGSTAAVAVCYGVALENVAMRMLVVMIQYRNGALFTARSLPADFPNLPERKGEIRDRLRRRPY